MRLQKISSPSFGMRIKDTQGLHDMVKIMKNTNVENKNITKVFDEIHKMEDGDRFTLSIDKAMDCNGEMHFTISHPFRDDYKEKLLFVNGFGIDEHNNLIPHSVSPLKKLCDKLHDHLWEYKQEYPTSECVSVEDHIKYALSK